ncbi:hypothetical protein ACJO1D_24205, partial [Vibrio parahaemolyticus]
EKSIKFDLGEIYVKFIFDKCTIDQSVKPALTTRISDDAEGLIKPLELLCMLAGLLAIAFVFYGRANFDVPASSYAQVQRWIEEN